MKLFKYWRREDFGTEHCFAFLRLKRRWLVQLSLSNNLDPPSSPYLILYVGLNSLIEFSIGAWKFGLFICIFGTEVMIEDIQ